MAVSHKPLFAPGARHSYSNTNYILAGLVVEAVTGKSLGAELQSRIFQPLDLRATTFPTTPRIAGPHAHGYYVFGKPPATDITGLSPYPWAGGAIVSTVAEVGDFFRALVSGRLLEPELLNAMKKTVAEGGTAKRYGLGLERFPTSCGNAWGHNGTFGYVTFAFTSVDGGRQAVLMVNQDVTSLTKRAIPLYFKLLDRAYCSTG
jgi:D-alanyl-D-alanine carboxypeptidase